MVEFINRIIWFLHGDTYTKDQLEQYKLIGCRGMEHERPWDTLIILGGFMVLALIPIIYMSFITEPHPINLTVIFTSYTMFFLIERDIKEDMKRLNDNTKRMERFIRHLERNLTEMQRELDRD